MSWTAIGCLSRVPAAQMEEGTTHRSLLAVAKYCRLLRPGELFTLVATYDGDAGGPTVPSNGSIRLQLGDDNWRNKNLRMLPSWLVSTITLIGVYSMLYRCACVCVCVITTVG